MQLSEEVDFQLLVDAFGEASSPEPIIEVQEEPKETAKQLYVKQMLARQEARIAAEEANAAIIEEVVVEPIIVEPIIEASIIEPIAPSKANKGKSKDGLFIKTGIGLLQGAIVKDLDASCFVTLMVLSSFMDNKGECYPRQDTLAEILGIKRETANRQIKKLLEYRTSDGSPILEVRKIKVAGKPYARAFYKFLPASGLSFG